MSIDWFKDISDFHKEVMQDDLLPIPHIPSKKYQTLRKNLIREEIDETLEAIKNGDLVKLADGICDSIVVLLGTAVTYGIDIRPLWEEVHRSNMEKKHGLLREDGKRLKPIGWKPPRIKEIIDSQIRYGGH